MTVLLFPVGLVARTAEELPGQNSGHRARAEAPEQGQLGEASRDKRVIHRPSSGWH